MYILEKYNTLTVKSILEKLYAKLLMYLFDFLRRTTKVHLQIQIAIGGPVVV